MSEPPFPRSLSRCASDATREKISSAAKFILRNRPRRRAQIRLHFSSAAALETGATEPAYSIRVMSYSEIPGGITAPQGFLAGSAFCGIKEGNTDRPDLVLVHSPQPTIAAATFTTNRVKAAPVRVSISHLRTDDMRAIVANAGNANACTGLTGLENAKRMAAATAAALGLKARQVMVCSTGRIGVQLPIEKIESTIATLPNVLKKDGSMRAAKALMTSDTFPKEFAVEFEIDGRPVRIGGIAKGAG